MKNLGSVVLLSGGVDSFLCLLIALEKNKDVTALSFDYGQSHVKELNFAKKIASDFNIPHKIIDISFVKTIGSGALVDSNLDMDSRSNGQLNVIVPGRNGLFIRLAAMMGFKEIYVGINESDVPDFPDCSRDYIDRLERVLQIDSNLDKVITPISGMSKKEIFLELKRRHYFDYALKNSLSCYRGTTCGTCPACLLRDQAIGEVS